MTQINKTGLLYVISDLVGVQHALCGLGARPIWDEIRELGSRKLFV